MEDSRGVYRVLVGKSEEKGALGRPRLRWEDSINPYPANMDYRVSS